MKELLKNSKRQAIALIAACFLMAIAGFYAGQNFNQYEPLALELPDVPKIESISTPVVVVPTVDLDEMLEKVSDPKLVGK